LEDLFEEFALVDRGGGTYAEGPAALEEDDLVGVLGG
jgi:hypothetical protein